MHLLISGIPGTGRSTFARWLVSEHVYIQCPSEELGSTFFDKIDRAKRTSEDVVIDYGFPLQQLKLNLPPLTPPLPTLTRYDNDSR